MKFSFFYHPHSSLPEFKQCWPNQRVADGMDALSYFTAWPTQPFGFPQRGVDNMPWSRKSYMDALPAVTAPAIVDPNFNMTFGEITDIKANELWELSRKLQKKILLSWSGGIDSTTVLIGLLKWARPDDLERLVIVTNKSATWESSSIFYKQVLGNNLKLMDFDTFAKRNVTEEYSSYINVTGQGSDPLMIALSTSTELVFTQPEYFTKSWRDKNNVITYMSHYLKDYNKLNWWYESIAENIESVDLPINSVYDFIWWFNFNYMSMGAMAHEWTNIFFHVNDMPLTAYMDPNNTFQWFFDPMYQQWSMNNIENRQLTFGTDLNQWKMPLKQYICEYTKDKWWLEFKTKMGSTGRFSHSDNENLTWTAITDREDGYRRLMRSNPDDLEIIISSIQENINPNY